MFWYLAIITLFGAVFFVLCIPLLSPRTAQHLHLRRDIKWEFKKDPKAKDWNHKCVICGHEKLAPGELVRTTPLPEEIAHIPETDKPRVRLPQPVSHGAVLCCESCHSFYRPGYLCV